MATESKRLDAYIDEISEEIQSLRDPEARAVLSRLCGEILHSCSEALYDRLMTEFLHELVELEDSGASPSVIATRREWSYRVLATIAAAGGLDRSPSAFVATASFPDPDHDPEPSTPILMEDASGDPEEVAAIKAACVATA